MDGKKWAVFIVLVGMACLLITMVGILFGDDFVRGYNIGMAEARATTMPTLTSAEATEAKIFADPYFGCLALAQCKMVRPIQCTLWDFTANEQMFFSGQAVLDFIDNSGPFEVQVFGAATWDDPSFVWTKDDLFDCTRSPGDKLE